MKIIVPVAALCTIILAAAAGTAVAATGGTFVLGRSNTATTTTVLANTGGTALSLSSPSGRAPLAVSNSVKVARLNADQLDGLDSAALQRRISGTCSGSALTAVTSAGAVSCRVFQAPLIRTLVVSPGGTPAAGGAALIRALAAITTASVSNPWLVHLEPGDYDLGAATLVMRPFVDLEGSGPGVTTIRSAPATAQVDGKAGVVQVVGSSELRDVTVAASTASSGIDPAGIVMTTPGTSRVTDVRVDVDGAGGTFAAVGLINSVGLLRASRVEISVHGGPVNGIALLADGGGLELVDGVASARGNGSANVAADAPSGTVRVAVSQLVGTIGTGALTCFGSYDSSFAAVTC